MTATITRRDLRRTAAGPIGLNGLQTGTANGAQTSTTLVDTVGLLDNAYDASRFRHAWLLSDTSGAVETHRVLTDTPSEGSLEIGSSFVTEPVDGTTLYEVHTHGVSPDAINEAINWCLEQTFREAWSVLPGEIDNGDLDDTTDTGWTTGTNSIPFYSTVGERTVLLITNLAAGGYASKTVLFVGELPSGVGQPTYRVYGTVATSSGESKIVVHDITNATDIDVTWTNNQQTVTSSEWTNLVGTFLLPEGCMGLSVRLVNTSASGSSRWRDIGLVRLDDHGVVLPDWLDDPETQIIAVQWRDLNNRLYTLEAQPKPIRGSEGSWIIPLPPYQWPGVPAIQVARPYTALTSDTATVPKHLERMLLHGVLWQCYQGLSRPQANNAAVYERLAAKHEIKWKNLAGLRHPINRNGRPRWSRARNVGRIVGGYAV